MIPAAGSPAPFEGADLAAGPLLVDPRTAAAYGHEHGRRGRQPMPRANFLGLAAWWSYLAAHAEGAAAGEQAILFGF